MPRPFLVIPDATGEICASPTGGEAWRAMWLARSILSVASAYPPRADLGPGPVIVWSGSASEMRGGGLFDEDPRTWGSGAWLDFEWACHVPSFSELLIRPHFRHVISDVPSCRLLLDAAWTKSLNIKLAFDPASMCAPSMLAGSGGRIDDHLRRMYEAIELFPPGGLRAVVVGSVAPQGGAAALSEGDPLSNLCRTLAEKHVPPEIPLLTPG